MYTSQDFRKVILYLCNDEFNEYEASRIFNKVEYNKDNFHNSYGKHIYDKWQKMCKVNMGTMRSVGEFLSMFDYQILDVFIKGVLHK